MARASKAGVDPAAVVAERPFEPFLRLDTLSPITAEHAHSGTSFFVQAGDGRRYKLRVCPSQARAKEIERVLRLLPDLFPAFHGRDRRYVLTEVLEEYRQVEHLELLANARRIGRAYGEIHRLDERIGGISAFRRAWLGWKAGLSFRRQVALLRRRGLLDVELAKRIRARFEDLRGLFGLEIRLEMGDIHKGNFMLGPGDDLRLVDEDALAWREKGIGFAKVLKTALKTEKSREVDHFRNFREGYGEVADAGYITPEFVQYVCLLESVRSLAHKVATNERLDRVPKELEELRDTVGA